MLFFWTVYKKNLFLKGIKKQTKNSTTVFNIDNHKQNVSWALNKHIKVISEGSSDTEDCSNGC